MVAIASRAALESDETHEAWVRVFATIMRPPVDRKRAACPNCGFYAVDFRYVADALSRVGLCALWCAHCGHGHTLARVRVPDAIDLIPLEAPDDVLGAAIPDFYDAAAQRVSPGDVQSTAPIAGWARAQAWTPRETAAVAERARDLLTARERQVVSLLAEGQPPAAIARALQISPATVRSYEQRIHWKLRHATGIAVQDG